ncbi:MAG: hypothetical protein Q4B57_04295 [Eubacteriales bacterium]|nr:hypothetical protein [Eubacteriales bacterium]
MDQHNSSWMTHPALKNIDSEKLQTLLSLAQQGQKMSKKELLPFLMAAASKSKSEGTSFDTQETDLIIQVLKQGTSLEESSKIDRLCSLMRTLRR